MLELDPITTIASVPAIVALVNLAKRLAPNLGEWALPLALALGVGLSLAAWAWSAEPWFAAAAQGAIFGLAASGLWDVTSGPAPRRASDEVTP